MYAICSVCSVCSVPCVVYRVFWESAKNCKFDCVVGCWIFLVNAKSVTSYFISGINSDML